MGFDPEMTQCGLVMWMDELMEVGDIREDVINQKKKGKRKKETINE
jgi:hypothetical protein